jgi:RNA polymerase sigma factor for flagellar operon FliA
MLSVSPLDFASSAADPKDAGRRKPSREPCLPKAERDDIVVRYQPLVKFLATRLQAMLPPGFDRDDLVGYGTLGLIEAIERYDPARGIKLATYAATRIRGAMLDALRASDPVPRSVRQHARWVNRAAVELAGGLGRTPTADEVAKHLEIPVARYRQIRSDAGWRTVSLQSLPPELERDGSARDAADWIPADTPALSDSLEALELREALLAEIERLPAREQMILRLRFYENLTGREIAERMGISESRVFQVLRATLDSLRRRLEPAANGETAAVVPGAKNGHRLAAAGSKRRQGAPSLLSTAA